MKSSGPLFTRQNPLPAATRVGKAQCYPSRSQSLSKKKKKTALSPVRSNQHSRPQVHSLSTGSQQLSDRRDHSFGATDGQPVFSESWPTTDCGSSPASAGTSDIEIPKQSAKAGKSTVSPELGVQQDSVLAKYIERFRHGQPRSREARQQTASATGEEQFWWMSPSSVPPSSTPTKTAVTDLRDDHVSAIFSPAGQCQHDRSSSPGRGSLSILSDTSQDEFDDTEILHIQEKASRLLLRGKCTLSDGSIPVSSEGLGCSDFSSPVSVDEPVRRPLIPSLVKSTTAKASLNLVQDVSSEKSVLPSFGRPTHPEEDILFQWRLRRKMEQAREWPQPLNHSGLQSPAFSWQAPSFSHPSAGGKAHKQQQQSTQPPDFTLRNTHPHTVPPEPEVVSEVLFSTVDPSPAQTSPASLASPPCIASAPPQHQVPPCKTQNSIEVISQLLQEAEDSDEKEFDDDPLLQVLRKQRKWIKEQISEVDSMLNRFPVKQNVT
ncbi:hypothetical protein INR49_024224 [Caranx melampygus]|nr:hypothetical protein INR49_024224 [Caranx melampygus]